MYNHFTCMFLASIDRKYAGDYDYVSQNFISLLAQRYLGFSNVLYIWKVWAIPTYSVYRLYDCLEDGLSYVVIHYRVVELERSRMALLMQCSHVTGYFHRVTINKFVAEEGGGNFMQVWFELDITWEFNFLGLSIDVFFYLWREGARSM